MAAAVWLQHLVQHSTCTDFTITLSCNVTPRLRSSAVSLSWASIHCMAPRVMATVVDHHHIVVEDTAADVITGDNHHRHHHHHHHHHHHQLDYVLQIVV